mmetsp:Transcript_105869/g.242420  ORF Transcript_105869/g.242420 Transcript_105869/m.242420 type:complete len:187 (-) Transcript_105869:191-751(-)
MSKSTSSASSSESARSSKKKSKRKDKKVKVAKKSSKDKKRKQKDKKDSSKKHKKSRKDKKRKKKKGGSSSSSDEASDESKTKAVDWNEMAAHAAAMAGSECEKNGGSLWEQRAAAEEAAEMVLNQARRSGHAVDAGTAPKRGPAPAPTAGLVSQALAAPSRGKGTKGKGLFGQTAPKHSGGCDGYY